MFVTMTALWRLPERFGCRTRTGRLLSSIPNIETCQPNRGHSKKSKQNYVPQRLIQIGDPLLDLAAKHGYTTVADIGADHGMLSCYLASKQQIRQVTAIDNAALTIQVCTQNVLEWNLSDKVEIKLGNGLNPLLKDERTVDAAIIAGTGMSSVLSILSGRVVKSRHFTLANFEDKFVPLVKRNTDRLQLKCIAIQPWPAGIVRQLQFSSLMMRCGWSFAHQNVCASSGSNLQLTTIFTNSSSPIYNDHQLDLDGVFHLMPLLQKLDDSEDSHRLAKAYLQKQYGVLTVQVMRSKSFSFNDLQKRIILIQSAAADDSDKNVQQICKLIVSLQQILGIRS